MLFRSLKRSFGINCFPADTESLEVGGENIMNRIEGFGELCMSAPTSDWNTACGTRSGFYMGADMSNSPSGNTVANWWLVIHLAHNNLYQRQIAYSLLNNSEIYTRIMNNGTWNSWTLVGSNASTVLYSNSSGTNGNITLRDSVANYSYIEIYFYTNDGPGFRGSQKVAVLNGPNVVSLQFIHPVSDNYYIKAREVQIVGTQLSTLFAKEIYNGGMSNSNCIYITKILGYK